MADQQKWIRIRKELYRQLTAEVRHRLGKESIEIRRYREEFETQLEGRWRVSERDELFAQISASRVIMLGDFHALQQSQKAHLRLLKQALKKKHNICIAIECLPVDHQEKLDRFLAGKMTEKDFLRHIKWQSYWGFPWEHYRPLFLWAQKHRIPMIAVNSLRSEKLKARDALAAQLIAQYMRHHPQTQMWVIYGEWHLAKAHLPEQLTKKLAFLGPVKTLTIFQNIDRVYFQLLKKGQENAVDVVKKGESVYALMSVPPWVKWQNYLMYLEQNYDIELEDEESSLDYTDHVYRYAKLISEELGFKVQLDKMTVYTAQDDSLWSRLEEVYSAPELKFIELMIEDDMSFYLSKLNAGYLARASVNHAAELAMQFVHAEISGADAEFLRVPQDFLKQIWCQACAYFGSKLINPKRKSDTLADIKASLAGKAALELGKEPLMLALSQKMNEMMILSDLKRPRNTFTPRKKMSYIVAAELLGAMMGERLYHGYREKMLSLKSIQAILSKKMNGDSFDLAYYELVEIIESLPAPFESKTERL